MELVCLVCVSVCMCVRLRALTGVCVCARMCVCVCHVVRACCLLVMRSSEAESKDGRDAVFFFAKSILEVAFALALV